MDSQKLRCTSFFPLAFSPLSLQCVGFCPSPLAIPRGMIIQPSGHFVPPQASIGAPYGAPASTRVHSRATSKATLLTPFKVSHRCSRAHMLLLLIKGGEEEVCIRDFFCFFRESTPFRISTTVGQSSTLKQSSTVKRLLLSTCQHARTLHSLYSFKKREICFQLTDVQYLSGCARWIAPD